jgi:phosphomannomutase/phosphoglucomutase
MKSHIFRQYDIRGIVGDDLDSGVTEAVGQAFASIVRAQSGKKTPKIAVGNDNRTTSPDLVRGLVAGIRAAGVHVLEVGTVPTPVLYWTEAVFGTDAGVQITGSHNPPEWNGVKMSLGRSALYGEAIQEIRTRIIKADMDSGKGSHEEVEVLDRYVKDISERLDLGKDMKVAVDSGNGVGALVAQPLLEALGATVTPLFCDSDGTFPNHHPDPTVDENLEDLIRAVRGSPHDLGVAFDGDADRIGAVDELGNIIRGDVLLLLYGLDLLKKRGKGQKLIFDVKCSQVLPEPCSGGSRGSFRSASARPPSRMRARLHSR